MIRVKSIMSRGSITVTPQNSIAEASELMVGKVIKSLVVVKDNRPIGVVHEDDLIKGGLLGRKSATQVKIKDVMHQDYFTVTPETKFAELEHIIKDHPNQRRFVFIVLEDGEICGIVTETDVINSTRDFTKFHYLMQEIILLVFGVVTAAVLFALSPWGRQVLGS